MPGRHRKATPTRAWSATAAAVTTLALATAFPAVAVLRAGDDPGPPSDPRSMPAAASQAAAVRVERVMARTTSRSFARLSQAEVEAIRAVAAEQAALVAAEQVVAARHKRRATTFARAKPAVPEGVTGRPCPDGSGVEAGLMPNTVKVYRAVCAAFPAVSSWGGRSGSGDHGAGRALDIMVTGSMGDAIAAYVRENASRLGVSEVIWAQRIWTVQRAGEGWRPMEDRGSATANHYDHVHVTVF